MTAGVASAILAVVAVVALSLGDEPAADRQAKPTPSTSAPRTTPTAPPRDVGKPERLTIATLEVKAPIKPVGTTKGGAQEVPKSIDDTGWWRDGVLPGKAGNAVIVGHTASSADGVFDDLGKLDRGDSIAVKSAKGNLRFAVTRVTSVKVEEFAKIAPRVYRIGGRSGLVLLTCGDWNGKAFESTSIVFANLVG